MTVKGAFDLTGRVIIITGGAGLLGSKHAEAVSEMGGIPVLIDIDETRVGTVVQHLRAAFNVSALGITADITQALHVERILKKVMDELGRVDILINNAANNPKFETVGGKQWSRLENFPLDVWNDDIAVGLTGAFLCSRVFGEQFARQKRGVILNIASDLSLIAPDQRIYRQAELPDEQQPVKPVTYSVVKSGLIGLTRYLASYWADSGVRVNALSPGGVFTNQDPEFVQQLTHLIPLGRMAQKDEYKGAVVFLVSDASSYMTGTNVVMDGGRTLW